jgi:hypothetical protein
MTRTALLILISAIVCLLLFSGTPDLHDALVAKVAGVCRP